MRYLLLVVSLFIINVSFAQADSSFQNAASVIVNKDPRIEMLVRKQASINSATKKNYGYKTKGYRLMVMNTNKRDEAIEAKTKVYTYFPELKAYLIYQAPFFRLKAGNFLSRGDAERYRKQLNALFPKGVFIINDIVEVQAEKGDFDE